MLRLILCATLAAWLPAPSYAQVRTPPPHVSGWTETATTALAAKGGIGFPLTAGTLKKTELRQYDEEGIDLSIRYVSADQAIQGTIFLSAPSLPDVGLRFLATDETIRRKWGPKTHVVADRLLPVAGVRAAERRVRYDGASDGSDPLVNVATFVRAGPWVVFGWVTGPAPRGDEINRDIDALVTGMTFGKGNEPLQANVIRTDRCEPRDRTMDAKLSRPPMKDALDLVAQPGVLEGKDQSANLPGRTPDRLCLESLELIGEFALQIYRPADPSVGPFPPRFYAVFGSAGHVLEVAESGNQPGAFYALRHGVGRLYAFGKFDREPSIPQIRRLIVEADKLPAYGVFTTKLAAPDGPNLEFYCGSIADCEDEKRPEPRP